MLARAGLLVDEGAFDHEVARRAGVAFLEAALLAQFLQGLEHLRAAADHDAIGQRVQVRQAGLAR